MDDESFVQKARNHRGSPQHSFMQPHRSKMKPFDCHDGCISISQELSRKRNKGLQRRGSLRSTYTETSDGSVSFSATKLGKLLSQGGFRFDKDFEVESISPDVVPGEIYQNSLSPRSALVRQSVPLMLPKAVQLNALSDENVTVRNANDPEKLRISVRKQISDLSTVSNKPLLSDTKIGKMLAKEGLKLEPELHLKGRKREPAILFSKPSLRVAESNLHKKEQQSEECPSSDFDCDASVFGCDITPVVCSGVSDESVANRFIVDEAFVPISERIPVDVLKARMEAKVAKKRDIINKIKMMDSRLSIMLNACHEASRKLKMMDVDEKSDVSSVVSEFSGFSF